MAYQPTTMCMLVKSLAVAWPCVPLNEHMGLAKARFLPRETGFCTAKAGIHRVVPCTSLCPATMPTCYAPPSAFLSAMGHQGKGQ